MAALEPAIYIPHHLKLRQTSRGDEKEKDKPPSCETVNKPSLNYLHESRLFQQVMSANMSKEKLLPYINFLDSDTISLRAGQSERSFKIHRKLIESKCKPVTLAFKRGFEEEQKGVYIFEDTSDGTLARFIEWAYTGGYPAVISAIEPMETSTKETEDTEPVVKEKDTVPVAETDFTFENHPLLAHTHLYIFCSIYLIPDLQGLAFGKMTACFKDLGKPNDLDTQVAVISALRVSFRKLPTHDPLLDWMARYAAYSIDKLRTQGSFHDLLKCCPILASRMVLSLNPASSPPWKIQEPKYSYPHYTDGYDGYDDDGY